LSERRRNSSGDNEEYACNGAHFDPFLREQQRESKRRCRPVRCYLKVIEET
jgi:hypothetical protein